VVGYLSTRGLAMALVSTPHGWCAAESRLIRFYEAVGRVFLRRFDRIFPLSPALLEDLLNAGFSSRRLRLVLNAVDDMALQPLFTQREWRRKDDPLNVLYVGRLSGPKGVTDLIEGFSRAKLKTKSRLYIVGDGPLRSAMVEQCNALGIADSVHFLGALDDVSPIYRTGSVLILPSYSEGIPRVVMEAFAAGVPVIGTDIPGVRQLIVPGETGLLVPTGDPTAIAKCLEKVEQNPHDSRRMAINARMRVKQRHSSQEQARVFAAEYKLLIESKHRRTH
jgi:glycosyltransferase involved in cell wall biosynthesis